MAAYDFARRTALAKAKGFPSYRVYRHAPSDVRVAATKALAKRAGGSYRGVAAPNLPLPPDTGAPRRQPGGRVGVPAPPWERQPPLEGKRHYSQYFHTKEDAMRYWAGNDGPMRAGIAYLVYNEDMDEWYWEILEKSP